MRRIVLGILVMILLSLPSGVRAALPPDRAKELRTTANQFVEADANRDGRVSQSEFVRYFHRTKTSPTYFEYRFRVRDKNGDGFLTQSEFLANPTRQDEFRALDRDRDGKITKDEWIWGEGPWGYEQFHRLDRNLDGVVSLPEYQNPPPPRPPKKGEKMY